MLDKRGKLFGKISIVDILVVCIVLVMAVGAFLSWQKINNNVILTEDKALVQNNAIDKLEITFRLKEVRSMTLESIQVGDDVYMEDTGKYLGTVVALESEPAKRLIYDNRGNAINAELPERVDVLMTVHAPGKRLNGGYFTADNVHLVLDSNFKIKTPTIQTTPAIEKIETVTGE